MNCLYLLLVNLGSPQRPINPEGDGCVRPANILWIFHCATLRSE